MERVGVNASVGTVFVVDRVFEHACVLACACVRALVETIKLLFTLACPLSVCHLQHHCRHLRARGQRECVCVCGGGSGYRTGL